MKWEKKQKENILRVVHRYSVFIIPEELRNFLSLFKKVMAKNFIRYNKKKF